MALYWLSLNTCSSWRSFYKPWNVRSSPTCSVNNLKVFLFNPLPDNLSFSRPHLFVCFLNFHFWHSAAHVSLCWVHTVRFLPPQMKDAKLCENSAIVAQKQRPYNSQWDRNKDERKSRLVTKDRLWQISSSLKNVKESSQCVCLSPPLRSLLPNS